MPTYKRGDTAPALERRVLDADGNRIALDDVDQVLVYVDDGSGTVVTDRQPATIVDEQDALIRYEWSAGELDVSADRYRMELVVVYDDATEQTLPADGYDELRVTATVTRFAPTLTVSAGDTKTVSKGDIERYDRADIDGTLDVDGVLDLTGARS